jgi:hypothetical protein
MRLSNPVFVSGHTRSGTNLLMRLIDGTPGIMVPPGEGKLNVLRRLHDLSYPLADDPAAVTEIIWSNIELNLDAAREEAFRFLLMRQLEANPGPRGFADTVSDLLATVERFVTQPGARPLAGRWMEKNHNLEFYWHRAIFLFGRPRLLFVLRNPFDNWVSWRQYMNANGLTSSEQVFAGVMHQHCVNEMAEARHGAKVFSGPREMAAKYGMRVDSRSWSEVSTVADLPLTFDLSLMPGADSPEGRFAWNYRLMYERVLALRAQSSDIYIVRYEDLVFDTEVAMRGILYFLGCEWSEANLSPSDHGRAWLGNSSFSSAAGVVDPRTVGRGQVYLAPDEIARMRAILEDVPGIDLEGTDS